MEIAALSLLHPFVFQSFRASELCTLDYALYTKQCSKSIVTMSDF